MGIPTETEVKDYYDKIYSKKGVDSMRPYNHYNEVLGRLHVKPGRKLLDVGAGTGHLLKAAKDSGLDVYGTDISAEAIKVCGQNVPGAHLVVAAGENLPFQGNVFDYVVCFVSLEHFLDMDKGMKEMIRVAKKDAKFMIIVPNLNYFLWKVTGKYGTKQQDMKETLMDYDGWRKFFEKHGLVVRKTYHDPWPWKSLKIFKHKSPWRIARRAFYRFVWLFIPTRSTYQFVFILTR